MYDLRRVRTPTCIYYGNQDTWSVAKDIALTMDSGDFGLPAGNVHFQQMFGLDHKSFVYGKDTSYFDLVIDHMDYFVTRGNGPLS